MAIEIDLNEYEESLLNDAMKKYGYSSPTEFVRQIVRMHRADERVAKLDSIASRMFPDGPGERPSS